MFDLQQVRNQFPIFGTSSGLVYLDSAASAQKPEAVLEQMRSFYAEGYANIHRGLYELSEQATARYEEVRHLVKEFLGAGSEKEIIFTHGTTEGLNLIAYSWARSQLRPGDQILTSVLEHHSNFVPWQLAAQATGASIEYVGLDSFGRFSMEDFRSKLNEKTRLVAISHLPNALGVLLPVQEIIDEAHKHGAIVVLDAAQSVSHQRIDVCELDVDFLVFSGHKLYGPTGVGVLFGKQKHLEGMPPFLGGGHMIHSVSVTGTTFNDLPYKFEAGTSHIAGVLGLGAAVRYVSALGLKNIQTHEKKLMECLENELADISTVTVLGPRGEHEALVCFTVEGIHPHDISQFLSARKICVRAGHHCAQPLLDWFGLPATTRVSLAVYNSQQDIQALASGLRDAIKYFTGKSLTGRRLS